MLPHFFRMLPHLVFILLIANVNAKPVTRNRALDYLSTFGYLHPDKITNHRGVKEDPEMKLEKAVKNFQEFAGLEATGLLDVATREKVAQPRCGNQDAHYHGANIERKWHKKDLTYSIDNFGPGLSEGETRKAIADAFELWAAASQLTFREVRAGRADIRSSFGRRDHGDGHMFDGEGHVLAHTYRPTIGKIHFDSEEHWMRMTAQDHSFDTHKDFFSVAIHQIGHGLGLQHSNDTTSIMAPFYANPENEIGLYERPKLDEETIREVQHLYRTSNSSSGDTSSTSASALSLPNFCLQDLKAIMQLSDNRLIAFSKDGDMITINTHSRQIISKHPFTEVFSPIAPSKVAAAIFRAKDSMILLFDDFQVFGYTLNEHKSTVVPSSGYPKKWTVSSEEEPFGPLRSAFLAPDGRIVVVNINNRISIYNENSNSMKIMSDSISDHFPDMPEDVIGFANFNHGTHVGFTPTEVFTYNFETHTAEKLGKLHNHMGC